MKVHSCALISLPIPCRSRHNNSAVNCDALHSASGNSRTIMYAWELNGGTALIALG